MIASGGVGNLQHLGRRVKRAVPMPCWRPSIFHFAEYSIGEAKHFMANRRA